MSLTQTWKTGFYNTNILDLWVRPKLFTVLNGQKSASTKNSLKWRLHREICFNRSLIFFFLNLDGLSKPTSKKPPTKAPKLTLTSEQRYWSFNSTSRFANLNCSQGDLSFPFLFSLLTCRYVRKTQISIPAKKMLQCGLPITLIRH